MASPPRPRATTASPASRTPRDDHKYPRKSHNSPYRHSPRGSSQVLTDELSTLRIREEQAFRQLQDERDAEQERLHQQALAQAAAEHERIFRSAIQANEAEALKQERQRKQQEEEERRALEAERSAKAEREAAERRQRKEELERLEQEQKRRAAEEREIQEKEARLAEQRRATEADATRRKQEQEDADRKAQQEAAAAAAKAAAAVPPAQPAQSATANVAHGPPQPASQPSVPPLSQAVAQPAAAPASQSTVRPTVQTSTPASTSPATTGSSLTSSPAQLDALHKQYLAVHQRLKAMRADVLRQCKGNPAFGLTNIGEWRRKLNMYMGQFTPDKINNRAVLKRILQLLSDIQKFAEPTIDISPFLVSVQSDDTEKRMPAPLVYMLNYVAKKVLAQFGADNAAIKDAVAIVAATVFSKPDFKFNNTISLIDILLAKYHVVCPVLFGISGDEKTQAGRERLGWWMEGGGFISGEAHKNRMTGLAIGYGCLSLRDFSKSQNQNPFPPTNYWRTLSHFANTPPAQLQPTHFVVLKALVENHIERFLGFYGHAGVTALRRVLVELPQSAPPSAARDSLAVLPQSLQKEMHLTL